MSGFGVSIIEKQSFFDWVMFTLGNTIVNIKLLTGTEVTRKVHMSMFCSCLFMSLLVE